VTTNRVLLTVLGGAFALLMHFPIWGFDLKEGKRDEPTLSPAARE